MLKSFVPIDMSRRRRYHARKRTARIGSVMIPMPPVAPPKQEVKCFDENAWCGHCELPQIDCMCGKFVTNENKDIKPAFNCVSSSTNPYLQNEVRKQFDVYKKKSQEEKKSSWFKEIWPWI